VHSVKSNPGSLDDSTIQLGEAGASRQKFDRPRRRSLRACGETRVGDPDRLEMPGLGFDDMRCEIYHVLRDRRSADSEWWTSAWRVENAFLWCATGCYRPVMPVVTFGLVRTSTTCCRHDRLLQPTMPEAAKHEGAGGRSTKVPAAKPAPHSTRDPSDPCTKGSTRQRISPGRRRRDPHAAAARPA
jgi:hypothetical protein